MDFWHQHGWIFLLFVTLFPRCTMLVATQAPFSLLHWLGWAITPRLTVAILATNEYWNTNTTLCVLAWIIALYGQNRQWRLWWGRSQEWVGRTTVVIRRRYF